MTPETASVDVDGHPVRYRATGTGPPVVLLHGLGRSLEDWEPLRTALPAHRLLALDLPGFGWSPAPPEPGLGTMAEHVAGCLDRLGITAPVHLVGNSLGGAVAMRLAVRHPARVASLALAAGAGFGREVTWALRVLDLPLLWRFLPRPDRRGVRTAERSLYADPALATPDRVDLALALARRPNAAGTLRQVARTLGSLSGVRADWRTDLLKALAVLDIPTLVVWAPTTASCPPPTSPTRRTPFPGPVPICSPAPAICPRSSGRRSSPPCSTGGGGTRTPVPPRTRDHEPSPALHRERARAPPSAGPVRCVGASGRETGRGPMPVMVRSRESA
ncbi:alpha/beta fold hydrolase [Streptomyces clavuligerus]|uniref:alpha/beta fold hydrolase n=1 Tax=Streptomyces clavuligerus TaxID=1901 RepID=UPI000A6CDDDA|nr:alpha/beta fold hydrolase [Streptomyces clavuligerus]AXU11652.1 alpha/beta fold hydrolase [Streptomyces clavuligerus]MBY6301490.1 alpha/beta fold hydrolase [Streptomyces clavuligerus]QPL61773.1 alpha/beta fold hydrolase [Streptomyces clavuligerus]QPL67806.1 alpha/beta fold hydrolase [Streptomyces clavuligerus]QPL73882.1 alpha/beta fold hydrolase [Streptomyces clavuligerus]